jgi:ribose transport system ATP-binding protein
LSGAEILDDGEIFFEGKKVTISNPSDGIAQGVSVIYQEFALVPGISVAENILFDDLRVMKRLNMINWDKLNAKAADYLNDLGFGDISPTSMVRRLSTSHQQVVEICKALARNAKVLVLDEPTAVLTHKEVEQLFVLLNQLRERGVSIIYISHRMEEIFRMCDRVTVMKDGRYVGTVVTSEINEQKLVNMMIGRALADYFPKRESRIGEVLLKAENLRAGRQVQDVSFDVREGEVMGLYGLVGAGRTEAVRAMTGADYLEGGKVMLNGKEITMRTPAEAFAKGVALLPEDRKTEGVLLRMPIKYNITLSSLSNFCKFGVLNLKKEDSFVLDFARRVSIKAASLMHPVNTLSGGNQQKVAIARLLACGCKILILDEPTRGVDVGAKIEIFNIVNELVSQKYAIVIVSSEMAEVIGMCDRVTVIREGRSVGVLNKEDINEQNIINLSMGVTV